MKKHILIISILFFTIFSNSFAEFEEEKECFNLLNKEIRNDNRFTDRKILIN
jgi:hypothetical protein